MTGMRMRVAKMCERASSRHRKRTEAIVMQPKPIVAAAIVSLIISGMNGFAAERFQKLSGPQIRAQFVGMEMTDNVHWADVFRPNGNLKSYSMGRKKDG